MIIKNWKYNQRNYKISTSILSTLLVSALFLWLCKYQSSTLSYYLLQTKKILRLSVPKKSTKWESRYYPTTVYTHKFISFFIENLSRRLNCGISWHYALKKNIVDNENFQKERQKKSQHVKRTIKYDHGQHGIRQSEKDEYVRSKHRIHTKPDKYIEKFEFENPNYNYTFTIDFERGLYDSEAPIDYLIEGYYRIDFSCHYNLDNTKKPYINRDQEFYKFTKSAMYALIVSNKLAILEKETYRYVNNKDIAIIILQYINIVYCIDTFITRIKFIKKLKTDQFALKESNNSDYNNKTFNDLSLHELKKEIALYEAEINGTNPEREYAKFEEMQNTKDKIVLLDQYSSYGAFTTYGRYVPYTREKEYKIDNTAGNTNTEENIWLKYKSWKDSDSPTAYDKITLYYDYKCNHHMQTSLLENL